MLSNADNIANAVKDGTNTVKKAVKGDVAGAVSDGLSAVSYALGVGNGKTIANASDLVNGASGAVSIGSDVLNGNVDGLDTTLDVLSTVASVDATRKRGSDNDISVFNDVKIKHSDKRSTLYKTAAKAKSLHKEFKQNNGTSIF